jgi:hypothetical protein
VQRARRPRYRISFPLGTRGLCLFHKTRSALQPPPPPNLLVSGFISASVKRPERDADYLSLLSGGRFVQIIK